MKKLEGKKVVVIGGSRGTGQAIVKALLDEAADHIYFKWRGKRLP